MHSRRRLARFLIAAAGLVALPCDLAAQRRAEFAPWGGASFARADQRVLRPEEIYPAGAPDLPFALDATVLFARGTPWTQARALRQIRLTAAIFAPCGIAVGTVRLVRLALQPRHRRLDVNAAEPATGVPAIVAQLASMLPAGTLYPAAFLIGRVTGTRSLAVSYRAEDPRGPRAPYFDTAWISYPAHWLPRHDDLYSPVAHEFAHLLCRCGHATATGRHLLHESRNFLSSAVLPEHCALFRSSALVRASP